MSRTASESPHGVPSRSSSGPARGLHVHRDRQRAAVGARVARLQRVGAIEQHHVVEGRAPALERGRGDLLGRPAAQPLELEHVSLALALHHDLDLDALRVGIDVLVFADGGAVRGRDDLQHGRRLVLVVAARAQRRRAGEDGDVESAAAGHGGAGATPG
jgi:hypothetical protein